MNNFMFNIKQLKMKKFIKYIWQLIISNSNATLEVPSIRLCNPLNYVLRTISSNTKIKSITEKLCQTSLKRASSAAINLQ